MPAIYAYGRISTDQQNRSLAIQKQKCEDWIEYQTKPGQKYEGYEYAGFFEEAASAVREGFLERQAGSRIAACLQPGDVIVASHHDRFVRGRGLDEALTHIEDAGAHLVLLDINMDTSTPTGRLILGVLSEVKGYEASEIKRRQKQGFANRKHRIGANCTSVVGWVNCGNSVMKPDMAIRRIGAAALVAIRENPEIHDRELIRRRIQPELDHLAKERKPPSLTTIARLAAYCAVGWPLIETSELVELYMRRVSNLLDPSQSIPVIRTVDMMLSLGCWAWDHPADKITKDRLQKLDQYRRERKFQKRVAV